MNVRRAPAIFITVNPRDRLQLATTIERLINLLDELEPDPDLEPYLAGWAGSADDREDDHDSGIGDYDGLTEQGLVSAPYGVTLAG